jgi:hypothetical protein
MTASRTFSFRAEGDLAERHDRALADLDRLRRERPRLADSVRYDFDVRLAAGEVEGLAEDGFALAHDPFSPVRPRRRWSGPDDSARSSWSSCAARWSGHSRSPTE